MTSPRRPGSLRFPATLERAGIVPAGPVARAASPAGQPRSPAVSLPQGTGLDSEGVRRRMVLRLREAGGVRDERVLAAMTRVERHRFVDPGLVAQSYEDTSLPIGWGQTISKPSVVARMIELLLEGAAAREHGSLGRTLEIGTGCGYQAAVLGELASAVFSIERVAALHQLARERLGTARPAHLRLVLGDGTRGHPPNAPYRSIIAAAAGPELPPAWLEQLDVGGRLVAPVAQGATGGQALVVVDRTAAGISRRTEDGVAFVPLKSGVD